MISVQVNLQQASREECERFFALPHVGGAIDSMATLGGDSIQLRLENARLTESEERHTSLQDGTATQLAE